MKKFSGALVMLLLTMVSFLISCSDDSPAAKPQDGESSLSSLPWEMGVALFSFHRHPFTTALAMADSADIKQVEGFSFYKLGAEFNDSTMGQLDQAGIGKMKKMMDDRGITMSSMYVEGAKNIEEWKNYFEMGKQLGLKYLVCEPARKHWNIIDSLAGIYNIKVAIHEHSKELSAYWHPDSVLAAIKGHANIGACADLGHWVRSGLDPLNCLKQLEGHIIGIHLKDVDELNNSKAADVNPGKGVIDFPAVLEELKRQKFNGVMHVECEHNLDNNLQDVKEAVKYIGQLGSK
jgi:sugar phosphate isomerase/epimerase